MKRRGKEGTAGFGFGSFIAGQGPCCRELLPAGPGVQGKFDWRCHLVPRKLPYTFQSVALAC